MKLIKPSFEVWEQSSGLEGIYKQIERAGRICYKSENKITEDSAKPFVDRMIKSGHGAMLEHGTVYLRVEDSGLLNRIKDISSKYKSNKYSKVNTLITRESIAMCTTESFITTNLRVLVENNWLDDLKYLCEPTEYHERRVTVHFVCDRGVSHEFVRHRVFSFAQESTRYCNYSKDKFGNEVTFIQPCWLNETILEELPHNEKIIRYHSPESIFIASLVTVEKDYFSLLDRGWKPQEARAVLPNALKTELVMTGFVEDWINFFKLRTASNAHPQARELAIPLLEELIKREYIEEG